MKKVLVVDDDPQNVALVAEMLEGNYQCIRASNGKEGLQTAVREQPDLILLDVNMPEMDGFEACRRLAEQPSTRSIPVIMLTTLSDMDSRVKGLNLGADDYVTKPFHARDLLARIQARLRRKEVQTHGDEAIVLGNLKLDPKTAEVLLDGESVKLTKLEFDLLRYFLERPNQLIDRNVLLGDLWPDAVVTLRTVDTHMGNLRKKLKGFAYTIRTVYGSGYILKTES